MTKIKQINYVIEELSKNLYRLSSIVETNFGGPAKNYIFEGTYEECQRIQNAIQKDTK